MLVVANLYRVCMIAASRDCEDHLTLVQLGLSRAHDHRDLANRCPHRVTKPDLGLKCLFLFERVAPSLFVPVSIQDKGRSGVGRAFGGAEGGEGRRKRALGAVPW